jgi:hypothetical protein
MRGAARLACAGVLLLLLDLRIERFDLLNDVVGAVLVVVAVGRLPSTGTRLARGDRLRALWVALAATTLLHDAFVLASPPAPDGVASVGTSDGVAASVVETVWTLVALFAYLALVDRYRALTADAPDLHGTWSTSSLLVRVVLLPSTVVLVVLGVLDLVLRLRDGAANGFTLELEGAAALVVAPVVLVLLAPVAHVALSLWRTGRDASPAPPDPTSGSRP